MNALKQRLLSSSTEIREARAEQVVTAVSAVLQNEALSLDAERRAVQAEKAVLLDLGPDHSESLRITSANFSPSAFIIKLLNLNAKLSEIETRQSVLDTTLADLGASNCTVQACGNIE